MIDELKELLSMDFTYFIIGIFLLIEIFNWAITSINKLFEHFGIEFKWMRKRNEERKILIETVEGLNALKQHHEDDIQKSIRHDEKIEKNVAEMLEVVTELKEQIIKMDNKMDSLESRSIVTEAATRESLADKINRKYKQYIELDGIPEDEYDEFINLHDAYKRVGGNHSGDAKFDYCIKHLNIIPSKINLELRK